MIEGKPYVKVILRGPDEKTESPWAEQLGERLFRLDNLPWFAYRVSDDDVIEADATDIDGFYEFVRVVTPSGNRLVRVIVHDVEDAKPVLDRLVEAGCHYEGYGSQLIAVSVPPAVSLDAVVAVLTESQLQWEYANPTYEDLFPDTDGRCWGSDGAGGLTVLGV